MNDVSRLENRIINCDHDLFTSLKRLIAALCVVLTLFVTGRTYADSSDAFRFVVMGDSRSDRGREDPKSHINGKILTKINQQILKLSPKPDFLIFLGDLAYRGGVPMFKAWDELMAPLRNSGIRVYMVLGNHELYAPKHHGDLELQRQFQEIFRNVPESSPPGYENLAYAFDHKNAFFIVLTTHYVDKSGNYHDYVVLDDQFQWFRRTISKTSKQHKFAFGHSPAFRVNRASSERYLFRFQIWEELDRNRFDIYFAGHEHLYARRKIDATVEHPPHYAWKNDVLQVIAGSCGAPLVVDATGKADVIAERFHFVVVDIKGSSLEMSVYDEEGEKLDFFRKTKP